VARFRKPLLRPDHDEFARMIDPALVDGDHTAALIGELLDAPGAEDHAGCRCCGWM
jgi:asparagine synthase (glutamine-hydrolysing)